METILQAIQSLFPENFPIETMLQGALIILGGFMVVGALARLIFGKRSVLNQSISSVIGILFIYAITVVIYSYGVSDLKFLISPLPFITISDEYLNIFNILEADYTVVSNELLNAVILAFLVNLANSWLPKGKKFITWLLSRCASVAFAMILHAVVNFVLNAYLPEGLLTYAPSILLGILVAMLAVGALKFVVGAILTTVNPIIAFLYTFFFANIIGKMLSKAMLTALLMAGLVYGLNQFGIVAVFIGVSALPAYIPLLIVLLGLWYLIGHIL